jgi:integrase/recombinase XerD
MPAYPPEEARTLAESWVTHLEAQHRSPFTIRAYTAGFRNYVKWCEAAGLDVELLTGPVETYMASLFGRGLEPATVLTYQAGVRQFSAWLAGELQEPDALANMKPPKLDQKIAPFVDAGQMAALLATCSTRQLIDVRDRAIISLLADSMVRSAELLDMTVEGVNVRARTAVVTRGKGGKGRVTAYSATTARDLDRYIRARGKHPYADDPWLWLPVRRTKGRRLTYDALYTTLRRRAEQADPPFRLYPHMLRSTGAISFRRKGGQVTSLMALGGWTDISMVQRYIRAAENDLAIEEARRLFDE